MQSYHEPSVLEAEHKADASINHIRQKISWRLIVPNRVTINEINLSHRTISKIRFGNGLRES